jgi:predicted PurR-regulated permease PerM
MRVIGTSIEVHPALLMVALIVASRFGFVWVVLAAPLVAIARDLFRYTYDRLQAPPLAADALASEPDKFGPPDVPLAH